MHPLPLRPQVQTIGFLSNLYANGIRGPFMVVVPLSTLGNWVGEFARWAPSIPVVMYHGSKAERAALRAQHMGRGECRNGQCWLSDTLLSANPRRPIWSVVTTPGTLQSSSVCYATVSTALLLCSCPEFKLGPPTLAQ